MAQRRIRTWDVPTRLLHLALAGGVAVAWWTSDQPRRLDLHVAGGTIAALALALRLVWGLIGTEHARWRAFAFRPRDVVAHLRGLRDGTAPRSLGHNPAASWWMLAGLALVAGLVVTGAVVLGGEEQVGWLAGITSVRRALAVHEVHAAASWALVAWIGVHLVGVVEESLRTRENLALAMVHGRKRPTPGARSVAARAGAGTIVLAAVTGAGSAFAVRAPPPAGDQLAEAAAASPEAARYVAECGDCHSAWHPSLLPARSWDALLDGQDDHIGEPLAQAPEVAAALRDHLVAHAAELTDREAAVRTLAAVDPAETPLRVTETPLWTALHHAVPDDAFAHPDVGSRGHCEACHADAATGRFANRAIHLPDRKESP